MGSVSDRSNPKYFLPLGLLLSCAIMFVSGLFKVDLRVAAAARRAADAQRLGAGHGLAARAARRMVHWFSTKERGLVVSSWNVAHNVGGAMVANFALLGVTLFQTGARSSTSMR